MFHANTGRKHRDHPRGTRPPDVRQPDSNAVTLGTAAPVSVPGLCYSGFILLSLLQVPELNQNNHRSRATCVFFSPSLPPPTGVSLWFGGCHQKMPGLMSHPVTCPSAQGSGTRRSAAKARSLDVRRTQSTCLLGLAACHTRPGAFLPQTAVRKGSRPAAS